MVESPAQFGRLKTLIHPGPVFRAHVTLLIQLCQRYELTLLITDKDFYAASHHVDVRLWSMG